VSARAWLWLFLLLLVAVGIGCGYLFWLQNSLQVVTVSLELWGMGRLGRKMPLPELIAWSGGIGFAIGLLPMFVLWWRRGSRIRQLEQQVAVGASSGSSDSASSWR
jgi:hypothetical protein